MKYRFAPYKNKSSKGTCPSCGKMYHWVYFMDTETNTLLPSFYGKCDNVIKCNYQYTPIDHPPTEEDTTDTKVPEVIETDEYNTIPYTLLEKSLKEQFDNKFAKYLINNYGEVAKDVLVSYKVGNSIFFGGSPIFWQIDENQHIRGGKIIGYDNKLKRIKEPYPKVTWVHSRMKLEKPFILNQCLYGLHLLNKFPHNKRICIVEAEKTCIICSIYCPDYLWLATCQLQGLNEQKLKVLEGRNVVFYPDKGKSNELWKSKLNKMKLGCHYQVSTFLEHQDSLKDGADLADYLMQEKLLPKNLAV